MLYLYLTVFLKEEIFVIYFISLQSSLIKILSGFSNSLYPIFCAPLLTK